MLHDLFWISNSLLDENHFWIEAWTGNLYPVHQLKGQQRLTSYCSISQVYAFTSVCVYVCVVALKKRSTWVQVICLWLCVCEREGSIFIYSVILFLLSIKSLSGQVIAKALSCTSRGKSSSCNCTTSSRCNKKIRCTLNRLARVCVCAVRPLLTHIFKQEVVL